MKKKDIPQPKYKIGDLVVFNVPSEGNNPPRRDAGKIWRIDITITKDLYDIAYHFDDKDGCHSERNVVRRVVLD